MKTFLRLTLLLLTVMMTLGCAGNVAAAANTAAAGGWEVSGQHTVQAGETVYCIARAYGVDPWAIGLQNSLANASRIHPGDVLGIPNVPATLPPGPVCARQFGTPTAKTAPACGECTCRLTHVVKRGDTLSRMAMHYGSSIGSIAQCNCIDNPNYIRAGQSLCIP
jgi:LysM repeat protein